MPLKGIPLSQPSFLFPGGRLRVEKRVRTENGWVWSNFSFLAEFRRGASACNDHRPFDGVPLVGINLDGSSLRDGFSANIPGNLGDSVLGDGVLSAGMPRKLTMAETLIMASVNTPMRRTDFTAGALLVVAGPVGEVPD